MGTVPGVSEPPNDLRREIIDARTVSDLGSLLRHLRRREARRQGRVLTYRELAARSGWSRGIIGEYLGGRVLPPADRFDVLVQLIGADPVEQGALATARDQVEERRRAGAFRQAEAGRQAVLPATPQQLPAPIPRFTGRARHLAALDGMLESSRAPGMSVTVLSGAGGIGKTALAVYWSHRIAHRFPDGQLYLDLRGFDPAGPPLDPGDALRILLRAYHVSAGEVPEGLDAQAALFRSIVAGRRVLLVLDNAQDADQVRPLLPGATGCLVLVTSRAPLTSLVSREGAWPVRLDLLTDDESWLLLAGRLGRDRLAAEPGPVAEIIERCARLPLALAVVAARAAVHPHFPLSALAGQLREARGLEAFGDDDSVGNVRRVFSWSYQRLSPRAASLFRLLTVHSGPEITGPAVASLAGLSPARCRVLIDELVRVHLLTEHTPGRYIFHDLLRAYAVELAEEHDSRTRRQTALRRVLDHYLHTAYTAAVLLYPYRDPIALTPHNRAVRPEPMADEKQARAWFAAEQHVLPGLIEQAARHELDRYAFQLAWTLVDFYLWQGDWHTWSATQRTALAAAVRLGDSHAEATAHYGLARPYLRLRRYRDAHTHLRRAVELFRRLGDAAGEGHAYFVLSSLYERKGRPRQALRHAQRCLALFEAAQHRTGRAIALNNVGWYRILLGEYDQGLAHCREALALQREIGDRHAEANTWDSIGLAYHQLSDFDEAVACYRRAAELFSDLGDRDNWAMTVIRLGDAQQAAGDVPAARRTWHQALAVLDELGRPNAAEVRARLVGGR
jgi:tetratricopeptide (TPR) repeat protein/transcriptional regulator with XRE-family HTH domain